MTGKQFDLYGWREMPLKRAVELISGVLGIDFDLHDSSYHGGEYYRGTGTDGVEIIAQDNFKDEDGYLAEDGFGAYQTLVYVNSPNERVVPSLAPVQALELLRSEVV